MQPIDPEDPRRPGIKVTASIRAAILDGELAPGEKLPSEKELAAFFGVSPVTVGKAIGQLGEEGYVSTRKGSGSYVRDLAAQPVPGGTEHPLASAASFLFEMGHLKNLPRAGWLLLGIPEPESVAEHSFRVGMTGMILAAIDGADIGRTVALCLFHDGHETRIGDVPSVGRAYVATAAPEAVTAHQTAGMPDDVARAVQDLTAEYEANKTREAQLAHDADKIETLLQAIEYQAQGYDAQPWRDTSLAALRTDAGNQLAQAVGSGDSRWWMTFAKTYHELRASTRASRVKASIVPDEHHKPEPQPVVLAIVVSRRGVLISRRNDGDPPWGFISGEIEPGESAADAAVREVKEETGLRVTPGHEISRRIHPRTGRLVVYVTANPRDDELDVFVGDESELAEVKWASLAEAEELLPGMHDPVRSYLVGECR
jgi:putative hydrolases of HD superfamily